MIALVIHHNYVRDRCMQMDDPLTAFVKGGFDTANTSLTNYANWKISQMNNETQMAIASANNDLQQRMNAENNQFAANQADLARQHDFALQSNQMAYDSPVAQMQRLQEAGLNPAVMMQGTSSIGASTPNSGAQASPHGSGITPSMPIFDTARLVAAPNVVESVISGLKALADIKKTGADTDYTRALESLVGEQIEDMKYKNMVAKTYGNLLADAQLQNILKDTALKGQQIDKLISEGQLDEANRILTDLKSDTEKEEKRLKGEQADNYANANKVFFKEFESRMADARARRAADYASADEHYANARLTEEQRYELEDMHKYIVDEKKFAAKKMEHESRLTEAEANEKWQTLEAAINYLNEHYKYMTEDDKTALAQAQEILRKQKFDNDSRYYHEALDLLERVNNGVTNWIPLAPDKEVRSSSENFVNSDGSWRRYDRVDRISHSRGR